MENVKVAPTSAAGTGDDSFINNFSQACVIVIASTTIIVSNIVNLIVWTRIGGIARVTKFILLNLSVSDLLVGIVACAPAIYPSITGDWPYGDIYCQISGVMHGVSCTMSIWCISLVGIDRYVAVTWPLRYLHMMSRRNTIIIMTTLWVSAFLTYLAPIATKDNYVYYHYTDELKMCGLYWEYPLYCVITTLYVPVASAVLVEFTAVRINRSLNRSHVPRVNANRMALRKLIASAVVFFACWFPYVSLVYVASVAPAFRIPALLQFWTLWLANCNSFMNVFVYSLTHKTFRQTVARLLKCKGSSVAPGTTLTDPTDHLAVNYIA